MNLTDPTAAGAIPEMEMQSEEEAEQALIEDCQALSYRSLWEVWGNDSDAVYDHIERDVSATLAQEMT